MYHILNSFVKTEQPNTKEDLEINKYLSNIYGLKLQKSDDLPLSWILFWNTVVSPCI
jgi:hypothetical protein